MIELESGVFKALDARTLGLVDRLTACARGAADAEGCVSRWSSTHRCRPSGTLRAASERTMLR